MDEKFKLQPRNATAWQTELVTGNPVTTRLESGVGNCFPGLEWDIRNLERRFFPHLAVDLIGTFIVVAEVHLATAQSSGLPSQVMAIYEEIAADTNDPNPNTFWLIDRISGNFGPFGDLEIDMSDLGNPDRPADAWTAVRLLPEGQDVAIRLVRNAGGGAPATRTLSAPRQAYIDANGTLNEAFAPGEMTQSLCSPWTHDFRDCGCFYWASNHPDVVFPQQSQVAPANVELDRAVAWQRTVRGSVTNPPAPAVDTAFADEMRHYEINHRWQELAIVLDGREQGSSYSSPMFSAEPFDTVDELVDQVRYAAGVELALTLEYLSAAYSLNRSAADGGTLADDVRASFAEVMRVAIGEMKHVRAVNDLLIALFERNLVPEFTPALRVASQLPVGGGTFRPFQFRSLTQVTLDQFIDIEAPSFSVDGLYGRILATVQRDAPGPIAALVQAIMADGTDHFETFNFIKEWLGRHSESDYLLDLSEPNDTIDAHNLLQAQYRNVLEALHDGYTAGVPTGADVIAQARTDMLERPDGIRGLCEALANAEVRVTFVTPGDPRFAPIGSAV